MAIDSMKRYTRNQTTSLHNPPYSLRIISHRRQRERENQKAGVPRAFKDITRPRPC